MQLKIERERSEGSKKQVTSKQSYNVVKQICSDLWRQ
jgi:hypothetical protein